MRNEKWHCFVPALPSVSRHDVQRSTALHRTAHHACRDRLLQEKPRSSYSRSLAPNFQVFRSFPGVFVATLRCSKPSISCVSSQATAVPRKFLHHLLFLNRPGGARCVVPVLRSTIATSPKLRPRQPCLAFSSSLCDSTSHTYLCMEIRGREL